MEALYRQVLQIVQMNVEQIVAIMSNAKYGPGDSPIKNATTEETIIPSCKITVTPEVTITLHDGQVGIEVHKMIIPFVININ